jgi:hypothetical protein
MVLKGPKVVYTELVGGSIPSLPTIFNLCNAGVLRDALQSSFEGDLQSSRPAQFPTQKGIEKQVVVQAGPMSGTSLFWCFQSRQRLLHLLLPFP